jgi:hypothetical protein
MTGCLEAAGQLPKTRLSSDSALQLGMPEIMIEPAHREDDSIVSARLRPAHVSVVCSRPSAQRRLRSFEASEPRCAPTRRNTSSSSGVRSLMPVRIETPDGPRTTNGA